MLEIIPSILTDNLADARQMIRRCEGNVSRIHVDIIDGKFVNNKTIEPSALEGIETPLLIDYHLMVQDPINWLTRCSRGQANRVIAQVEKMPDQIEFLKTAQEYGFNIGFALDLDTPVSTIEETILKDLDIVLVMSVKAGWGGQRFHPSSLTKVAQLAELKVKDATPFRICVDGGETLDTIEGTTISGADEVVIGRRLFVGDLKTNIEKFLKAAQL